MKIAMELSKHTEDAGPKTSHPNPIHPSAGPQLDVILRTPAGPPHQNLFPKSLDLSIRSHIATCHHRSSRHSRERGHLTKTPQESCQLSRQDTWTRTWGLRLKRPRTPRGHAHDQGTSPGRGHLGGAPPIRAHLKDMDTYIRRHWTKEHTSRTRTPTGDT